MKELPIGISTLEKIINNNMLYVDKTEFAYKLVKSPGLYFLSRPRRFGKSLFLNTLQEIFNGSKDLFKNLFIYDKWNWEKIYPVIKIDMTSISSQNIKKFESQFYDLFKLLENKYKIKLSSKTIKLKFKELIIKLNEKYNEKVIILIDEYDKPLLDVIENIELTKEIRDNLREFYSVIKEEDENIQFVFITGITKFSKLNIFSGINNLNDITLNPEFATICGYTENDLDNYFKDYLNGIERNELKKWYNGYNFMGELVYNPFDILLFISNKYLYRSYWFETGSPKFLVDLMKKNKYFIPELENIEVGEEIINTFEIENIDIKTLLFQTGYLTIKEYINNQDTGLKFILKYPNYEVKKSLNNYLFSGYTELTQSYYNFKNEMENYIEKGDLNGIKNSIIKLFASIPYKNYTNNELLKFEGFYASVLYTLFLSIGCNIIAEDITNYRQIDLTIIKHNKIYIIEIKVLDNDNISDNFALKQIKDKKYSEKYKNNNSIIYEIGIIFSSLKRNIIKFDWNLIQ